MSIDFLQPLCSIARKGRLAARPVTELASRKTLGIPSKGLDSQRARRVSKEWRWCTKQARVDPFFKPRPLRFVAARQQSAPRE